MIDMGRPHDFITIVFRRETVIVGGHIAGHLLPVFEQARARPIIDHTTLTGAIGDSVI
jgi:hypothetical protein